MLMENNNTVMEQQRTLKEDSEFTKKITALRISQKNYKDMIENTLQSDSSKKTRLRFLNWTAMGRTSKCLNL